MSATRKIKIGSVEIGGGNDIAIQSMLSVRSDDVPGNAAQALLLEQAGCDIVRVAIPDMKSIRLIEAIKSATKMPLVADIHFDYRLATEAVAAGIDKIRINPGNIGGENRVKAVADACRAKSVPIRIGINSGSIEKKILAKHGSPTAAAMVESALYHASLLESFDFNDIVISLKSSSVKTTVEAYRLMSEQCGYPLHLGVTEAGSSRMGLIKSSIGIGSLLLDGIGDTIRVTLTAPVVEEIAAAKDILKAIGKNKTGINIISCPTCGRTSIDVISLTNRVEEAFADCGEKLTIAVMGCAVNGPGEAREADVAICGGGEYAVLYSGEKLVAKLGQEEVVPALILEAEKLIERRKKENA